MHKTTCTYCKEEILNGSFCSRVEVIYGLKGNKDSMQELSTYDLLLCSVCWDSLASAFPLGVLDEGTKKDSEANC